jgi:hypothetical protein
MKSCEFIFNENSESGINVKLIFREEKFALCGPPIIKSEN